MYTSRSTGERRAPEGEESGEKGGGEREERAREQGRPTKEDTPARPSGLCQCQTAAVRKLRETRSAQKATGDRKGKGVTMKRGMQVVTRVGRPTFPASHSHLEGTVVDAVLWMQCRRCLV